MSSWPLSRRSLGFISIPITVPDTTTF